MTEPTSCCAARRCSPAVYCGNCDLLVGLDGLHVLDVRGRRGPSAGAGRVPARADGVPGLRGRGAQPRPTRGRADRRAVLRPAGHARVVEADLVLPRSRRARWRCSPSRTNAVARPRGLLTTRAAWWATRQLRREHASVLGLARQLGTTWKTVWRSVKPLLEVMDADPTRFDGVETLGVDEHVWHHVSPVKRGPKELTGMVDLTRDAKGKTRARLLDLVPGRSRPSVPGLAAGARGGVHRGGEGRHARPVPGVQERHR